MAVIESMESVALSIQISLSTISAVLQESENTVSQSTSTDIQIPDIETNIIVIKHCLRDKLGAFLVAFIFIGCGLLCIRLPSEDLIIVVMCTAPLKLENGNNKIASIREGVVSKRSIRV